MYWLSSGGPGGLRIANNTIADNSAPAGPAVYADGDDATVDVVNNIIVGPSGQAAIHCGEVSGPGPPGLRFNDVYSPNAAAYSGSCGDQTGVNSNISVDPAFVGGGDYHLQPSSPAIDGGTTSVTSLPAPDIDRQTRPMDGDGSGTAEVDMGVDELKSLTLDTDGDTVPNGDDSDDDADGCADDRELGLDPRIGGARNPHNFWDFFDAPTLPGPARNQSVTIGDVAGVVSRFGATRPGGPPSKAVAFAEAFTTPPPAPAYHAAYDRTVAGALSGPPNGSITVQDITAVIAQFAASCV
jgi:hypothetical protein